MHFVGNSGSGTGVYQFSHDENNDTRGGQLPLPSGQFIVECILNGLPSNNITYSLPSDGNGVFRINTATGELALQGAGRLDYETTRSYVLNAACSIPSDPSIPMVVVQINFNIRPVNEFKPEIVLDSSALTRRNLVLLNEFSEVGEVVAIRLTDTVTEPSPNSFGYTIVDRDKGETELLNFNTNSTFDEGNFRIDENGTITLSKKLDFDGTANPSLNTIDIQVCNSLPLMGISCGNRVIRVGLTWSNDNSPTFSQEIYTVNIPEGFPAGGQVANVSCIDGDRFVGERMSVVSSSDLFNVSYVQDLDYQLVYSIIPLDYEVAQSHSTVLTCLDNLRLTTSATLIVQVLPLNDNLPFFPRSTYRFQVNRQLSLGSQIGSVQAIDADVGMGSTLAYTLTDSSNFQIESDGTLILSGFVYIFEGQIFVLQVSVSDGEYNSTAQVFITMTGVISISEIIIVCMGTLIFIVLVIFIIATCCCYWWHPSRSKL